MSQQITKQASVIATQQEQQRTNAGQKVGALTVLDGKLYAVDGREFVNDGKAYMPKESLLVDIGLQQSIKSDIVGASGDIEKLNDYASKIYSPLYQQYLDEYDQITAKLDGTFLPYQSIIGAAGSVTPYETVRRAEDLIDVVGQQYDPTEYTALNAVTIRNTNKVRFKRPRKTSALLQVEQSIGDNMEPQPVQQAFTEAEVDVFADATQFQISMREQADTTFSIEAEFLKELPGMFARAKDEKVMALINGLTGVNQGDWDAVTGNFYTVDAAEDVETAINAIKSYGSTHIGIFASDSLRLYNKNQKAPLSFKTDPSTAQVGAKGPYTLANNAGVTAFVNPSAVAGEYTIVAKESYADMYQSMKIQTSFKNERTAGQNEHRYWFDFNEVFENTSSAAYQGQSVGA